MNFQQYEIFRAIMDTGSVSAAADRLNISQPSVSKHKMALEHRLELTLFERKGNRLVATPEGQALYEEVQRIYSGIDHLEDFASALRYNQGRSLSVAAIPLISYRWLPREIARFMNTNQDVSLSLSLRNSSWILGAVASRKIDFGIVQGEISEPEIIATDMMDLPFVCVCPQDHRLAQNHTVSIDDLKDELVVTLYEYDKGVPEMIQLFETIKSMLRLDVSSSHLACEFVSQGLGVTVTDALAALDFQAAGLVMKPFEPLITTRITMLRAKNLSESDVAKSAGKHLTASAQALQKMFFKK
ncbi:MAG: LysR substrate-binding domain-containing protein [Pseudomonadota bacterium]